MTAAQCSPAGPPRSVALVGNPNCGKTALFNLLTGARQKVANYAGVTVERKVGTARLPDGSPVLVIDLPGTYSLHPMSLDEEVTLQVIEGRRAGEEAPDLIVAVVDATNLRMNLRLVLELRRLGRPMVVALNMMDTARAQGLQLDAARLAQELGCPVVETVAVDSEGHAALLAELAKDLPAAHQATPGRHTETPDARELQGEVRRLLGLVSLGGAQGSRFHPRIDAWLMHPVWGLVVLAALLFVMFQAVFTWAEWPKGLIEDGVAVVSGWADAGLADGPLKSLLIDGVLAGAGGVLVFLPQILILFAFILALEDSGYLPRAAFLLDTLMGKVGLSGRAFIPMLSSFACAVPGIMATRSITHWRDRLATIMLAPLMTCSARLPVYTLLIGAFVPARDIGPGGLFDLRGLVMFGLYVAGVLSACAVGWLLKRTWLKSRYQPLMLELPPYRLPSPRTLAMGLWERARIFLLRVGTIIFALTVVLWFLSTWPAPPPGYELPAITYSVAGRIGQALEWVFSPVGFNWQICIALVPGLAAREVVVGALGTVYALSASGDAVADALTPLLASQWSAATAYALIAWFIFAPQCLSTLATVRRETNHWRYPLIMAAYQFALGYAAAFLTYRVTLALGA